MSEYGSFERHSDKIIEAKRQLEISHDDHQFLSSKIISLASDLSYEAEPQLQKFELTGIKLDEVVMMPHGSELYPNHNSLSMRGSLSPEGQPTAVIELFGHNADRATFNLRIDGVWELLRTSIHQQPVLDRDERPSFEISHTSMLSMIDDKLALSKRDRLVKDGQVIKSDRYQAFTHNLDVIYTTNEERIKSLRDTLQPFAARSTDSTAYSNVSPGLPEPRLITDLLVTKTNRATTYDLSVVPAEAYDIWGSKIRKSYHYNVKRSTQNLLPESGHGDIHVEGRQSDVQVEKLQEYALLDQYDNYPVELFLQGLDLLSDSSLPGTAQVA